jgi:hypothetical protein
MRILLHWEISTYKIIQSFNCKTTIKKSLGIVNITAISLESTWYYTQKTLRTFRQKGI